MGTSIFLAKLIGLYLLVFALIALFRRESFEKGMKAVLESQGLVALSGVIILISGLAILIGHPIWEASWRVVISLIGMLAILQGIARIGFWESIQKKFPSNSIHTYYWYILAFLFIVGAFLTYHGFKAEHSNYFTF